MTNKTTIKKIKVEEPTSIESNFHGINVNPRSKEYFEEQYYDKYLKHLKLFLIIHLSDIPGNMINAEKDDIIENYIDFIPDYLYDIYINLFDGNINIENIDEEFDDIAVDLIEDYYHVRLR